MRRIWPRATSEVRKVIKGLLSLLIGLSGSRVPFGSALFCFGIYRTVVSVMECMHALGDVPYGHQ